MGLKEVEKNGKADAKVRALKPLESPRESHSEYAMTN